MPTIGVQIVVCAEAKGPRLLMPPKLSSYIRKDMKNLKVSETTAPGRVQTIVIGLLMSFAFLSGGVWLFRSRQSRNIKIIAVLGVTTLGLLVSTIVLASSDWDEALRSKQRMLRNLQAVNIAQDFEVEFFVMEDNSDLRDVVLIVPLQYTKRKEINRPPIIFGPEDSNFAINAPRMNANFANTANIANAANRGPRLKKP